MTITGLIILGLILFVAGMAILLLYMVSRLVGSDGWDDSNIINGIRLLTHAIFHPEDFGRMFYLTQDQLNLLKNNGHNPDKPFWYVSEDEFDGVVATRPSEDHV